MARTARPYQQKAINEYFTALHAGYKAPLIILPTGGGKTFIFTMIVKTMLEYGHTCIISCHRSELVRQISSSLATEGIMHDYICSDKTRAICGNVQQMEFGRTYYQPGARCIVASVQTINSRLKDRGEKENESQKRMRLATEALLEAITFGVYDEAHHLLRGNTFGRPIPYMNDNAKYLLVSATPGRTDGQGMGCEAMGGSGIVDCVIEGPQMRWLIDNGFLCDYKIFEPPTEQADMSKVRVSAGGEYNMEDQAAAMMEKAQITGDVVRHYQELIYGQLTIVFCCNISHAQSVADAYQSAGIPSAVLHGGDDELTRFKTLKAFEARQIWVLVTVDLVSEGFDLPAIEAAQFLRRTMSLSWWIQACGRVLRPAPGKPFATILDHVGNWRNHLPPDKPRHWSMADRKGGGKSEADVDDVPTTRCRVYVDKSGRFTPDQCASFSAEERQYYQIRPCGFIYDITESVCPECGNHQPLAPRGEPIVRGGQLVEVSPEELARLRGGDELISDQAAIWRAEVQEDLMKLTMTPRHFVDTYYSHLDEGYKQPQIINHQRWRAAVANLRPLMDEWMEYHSKDKVTKEASQQLFLNRFGINVYYAQVLKPKESIELAERIKAHLVSMEAVGGLTYV